MRILLISLMVVSLAIFAYFGSMAILRDSTDLAVWAVISYMGFMQGDRLYWRFCEPRQHGGGG